MKNYHRTPFILIMVAIHFHLFELKELFQSSTNSFIPKMDSCLDQNVNATSSCRPDIESVTRNTIIQSVSDNHDDNKIKQMVEQSNMNGESEIREVDKNGLNKVDSVLSAVEKNSTPDSTKSTIDNVSFDRTQSNIVLEELNDKHDHLSNVDPKDIMLDKRASMNNDKQKTASGNDLNTVKNAKLEKTNEIIPDTIAEETSLGVTLDDVGNEPDTVTVDINIRDPMTEAPGGMTTVGVTEATGDEILNGSAPVPTLVVKEDEENRVTHKSTSIPRNTITRVAVRDCPCDVIKNVCDINCCCDNDCSAYDRLVFSHCLPLPSMATSQYCFSKQLIYIKNSPYYVSKHPDNSLLCIETENLKSKINFTNLEPIRSLKTFAKLFDSKKHNEWSGAVLRTASPYSLNRLPHNQSYKVGQPIWMLSSKTVKLFELPCHSILSDACSSEKAIFYLKDSVAECIAPISECSPISLLTPSFYYKSFLLLASTSFENLTSVNNCTKQSCLQVEPYICRDSPNSCTLISDEILPVWDPGSQICANVTESIHYVFKHNGTQGIIKVLLYVGLTNVSLGQRVRLKTKVSFEWYKSYERSFHRSGNPGYRSRAPLISGTRLTFNMSHEDQTIPSIHFSPLPQDWITMLTYTPEGGCDANRRRNILFGTNERVMCRLVFDQKQFTDCDSIQHHIYKLLLGSLRYYDTNTYIAANGDPSIYNIEDWVPILWSRLPHPHNEIPSLPCGNLATGINIKLIHAYYGAYANPDSKIIGVLIETFKHSTLTCVELSCKIDLSWSVSFVRSMNSPFTKFPEPPVYEIKLPSNFFYPFLSSAKSTSCGGPRTFVLVLCLTFTRWVVAQ